MQSPAIEFQSDNMLTGYRLEKLEIYNWGTFHNKIWTITPKGGTALLTGSNGSGKSTLVDALITLLVPNIKRGYNLASGAVNKKERNERSYVQGAFDKYKGEESQQSQTRFLRDKNEYSVLLATFANEGTAERITLGQVFYFQSDQLKKMYIVGPGHLSIAEHFSSFENIRTLKRILDGLGAEIFDKFTEYSKRFRRAFGLRSEKALDLFNQTVSIKAIKDLNSFVRNHMLEAADIGQTIEDLRRHFEDLTHTYQSINVAKKQRDMLRPIVKIGDNYEALTRESVRLKHCVEAVPGYFARCELDLLAAGFAENMEHQERAQHNLEAANLELGRLQTRERDLDIAINTDKVGHQIRTIEQQIQTRSQDRDRARKQSDEFESHLQYMEWPAVHDENTFNSLLTKGQEEQKIITDKLKALEPERDEIVTTLSVLNKDVKERQQELESLRNRKSQIPSKNLSIRQRLLDELDLDAEDLPFIGELVKVDDEETEWLGAAERLLHSFALRILVPEVHYERVNEFVNREQLQGRIVYARVPATQRQPSPPSSNDNTRLLYNKLEIKPDTPHRNWLKGEIVRLYDHVCCEVHEFKHLKRALTRTGLIKQNSSLHEKNDRFRVDDASKYILGWNNRNKMLAIETQIQRLGQQLEEHILARVNIDDQISLLRKRIERVKSLARFNHFSEIDWQTIVRQIQDLEKEKRLLEASSDRLKQLRDDLGKVRTEMHEASDKVKGIESDQTLLKDAQLRYQKQEIRCKELLTAYPVNELDKYAPAIKAVVTREPVLDNIADVRDLTRKLLDEQLQAVLDKQAKRSTKLVGSMKEYIHIYDVTEADASPESLPDFQRFLNMIEKEDLPRHEKKFRELLKTKLLENISFFEHALFRQEEEIYEKVVALNHSLRPISYTTSTYIQLQAKPTQNVEIREFKRLLRDVFDGQHDTQESNEKTFNKINTLIDRFNEDDRWTRKVTDVRFWLDFNISERSLESDEEIKYITDSGGLSGGQKAKLAYTILASAIAYQFGLDQSRASSNSFRFVVIDEAFSKIDEDNARYA
ncbi:MAG: ATP-binding protein, partial [Rhodothermales bacterium]